MRMLICLGAVLMWSISLAAAPTTSATSGTVNGIVLTTDNKPAPNQKVRIKHVGSRAPVGRSTIGLLAPDSQTVATVSTDKDGKFTQSLDPGEYWAEAGGKTLGYAKERFTIKTGEATDVKLTLTKDETQK